MVVIVATVVGNDDVELVAAGNAQQNGGEWWWWCGLDIRGETFTISADCCHHYCSFMCPRWRG